MLAPYLDTPFLRRWSESVQNSRGHQKPPRMRSTHCRVATGLSAWGAGAVVKFASLHFAKTSKHHQEERHVEPQNVRIIRGGQRRRATIGSRPARSARGRAGGAGGGHHVVL